MLCVCVFPLQARVALTGAAPRGDPTVGVLVATKAEVEAAALLAAKSQAYTSVPDDPGVDGLMESQSPNDEVRV